MGYKNAKDVLPENLLYELQKYAGGDVLYIPIGSYQKSSWGVKNGSRKKYDERNADIRRMKNRGSSIGEIAETYYLSPESIKKIVK